VDFSPDKCGAQGPKNRGDQCLVGICFSASSADITFGFVHFREFRHVLCSPFFDKKVIKVAPARDKMSGF
jgi:hypothetical protein